MFEDLNAAVLDEINSIDQARNRQSGQYGSIEISNCLKAAALECRLSPEAKSLSEQEIQQLERGFVAAQRISTKAFESHEI